MSNSWGNRAKRYLKVELKRREITYTELADRLTAGGIKESAATIGNKIARGSFSASFLLAALHAIGVEKIELDDL